MIRVNAYGVPVSKGSPQVVTRGHGGKPLPFPRVLDDTPELTAWSKSVAGAALVAVAGQARPIYRKAPLVAGIEFRFERPESVKRLWPDVKPDIDKLARAVFDPLEDLVFDNDSRIVGLLAVKRYVGPREHPGALVQLGGIAEDGALDILLRWFVQALKSPFLIDTQTTIPINGGT